MLPGNWRARCPSQLGYARFWLSWRPVASLTVASDHSVLPKPNLRKKSFLFRPLLCPLSYLLLPRSPLSLLSHRALSPPSFLPLLSRLLFTLVLPVALRVRTVATDAHDSIHLLCIRCLRYAQRVSSMCRFCVKKSLRKFWVIVKERQATCGRHSDRRLLRVSVICVTVGAVPQTSSKTQRQDAWPA